MPFDSEAARADGLPGIFARNMSYRIKRIQGIITGFQVCLRDEAVGPAGPTTATRMDDYTEMMLATGLIGMVGKAERGEEAIGVIAKHHGVYLTAVGGAAYLVSKAIKKSVVIAFEDLGMEAIYEFTVQDMPVTVAVSAQGDSVHTNGPKMWKEKIAHSNIAIKPV